MRAGGLSNRGAARARLTAPPPRAKLVPVTATTTLTVDLGNSGGSAALVTFGDAGPEARELARWDLTREALELHHLSRALGEERPARAAVSAVGNLARERRAVRSLELLGLDVQARPDCGLELRLTNPETCGSDRQYAARAALELESRAARDGRVLVVDVGTALTVDAAERQPGGPVFLGGSISLGPGSHARALAAAGARLPDFDLDGGIRALGRSTPEALRSGVVVGLVGATLELAERIADEAFGGTGDVQLHLTGGARSFVEPRLAAAFPGRLHVDPFLVHVGLAHAAVDRP